MDKKRFPLNVEAMKTYGLEQWLSEDLVWPVGPVEFRALRDDIETGYLTLSARYSQEHNDDVLMCALKLLLTYLMTLQAQWAVTRLRLLGREPFAAGDNAIALFYGMFLRKEAGFSRQIMRLDPLVAPVPAFATRAWGHWNAFLRNVKYTFQGQATFLPSRHFYCLRYPGDRMASYVQQQGKMISYFYPYPLIVWPCSNDDAIAARARATTEDVIKMLKSVAAKYGINFDAFIENDLRLVSTEIFVSVIKNRTVLYPALKKIQAQSIVVGNLGKIYSRLLCMTAKQAGVSVTGEEHGHNFGLINHNFDAMNDLAFVDNYLVSNVSAARIIKATGRPVLKLLRTDVNIIPTHSAVYESAWEESKKKRMPQEIRTVMFMEYPLTGVHHKEICAFWSYALRIMLPAARFVRAQGKRTILKLHPDRLRESKGFYESFFDEIIADPFEKVYQRADALFYSYIASTTFGFGLHTHLPIMFYDVLLYDIVEELRPPLSKRCWVIPSAFDDKECVRFDKEVFAQMLARRPQMPDDTFLRKYTFANQGGGQ